MDCSFEWKGVFIRTLTVYKTNKLMLVKDLKLVIIFFYRFIVAIVQINTNYRFGLYNWVANDI